MEYGLVHRITVDYRQSLQVMVEAGKYDEVDPRINYGPEWLDYSPDKGIVDAHVSLAHIEDGEVTPHKGRGFLRGVKELGIKPAPIEYLLALGAQYPSVQRTHPVFCVNTFWNHPLEITCIPLLACRGDKRTLELCLYGAMSQHFSPVLADQNIHELPSRRFEAEAQPIVHESRSVTIDYRQSFAEMVVAGKYDRVSEDTTAECFSIAGMGVVQTDVLLVTFNKGISTERAVVQLGKWGLEAAPIEYLLALGAQHPDLPDRFDEILCLGCPQPTPFQTRPVPSLERIHPFPTQSVQSSEYRLMRELVVYESDWGINRTEFDVGYFILALLK